MPRDHDYLRIHVLLRQKPLRLEFPCLASGEVRLEPVQQCLQWGVGLESPNPLSLTPQRSLHGISHNPGTSLVNEICTHQEVWRQLIVLLFNLNVTQQDQCRENQENHGHVNLES